MRCYWGFLPIVIFILAASSSANCCKLCSGDRKSPGVPLTPSIIVGSGPLVLTPAELSASTKDFAAPCILAASTQKVLRKGDDTSAATPWSISTRMPDTVRSKSFAVTSRTFHPAPSDLSAFAIWRDIPTISSSDEYASMLARVPAKRFNFDTMIACCFGVSDRGALYLANSSSALTARSLALPASNAAPCASEFAEFAVSSAFPASLLALAASSFSDAVAISVMCIETRSPARPKISTSAEAFSSLFARSSGLIQFVSAAIDSPTTPTKTTKADPYAHQPVAVNEASQYTNLSNSQQNSNIWKVQGFIIGCLLF